MDIKGKAYIGLMLEKQKQKLWREKSKLHTPQKNKFRFNEIIKELQLITKTLEELRNE